MERYRVYLQYLRAYRGAALFYLLLLSLALNAWQWWHARSLSASARELAEAIAIAGPAVDRHPEAARLLLQSEGRK